MREFEFIKTIQKTLESSYIGDDCAYLSDLGIVMTQDSLVEGVHFLRNTSTAYQLGFKSVAVNLSDVYAAGAEAKYLTISLSLPEDIDKEYIKEFYNGAKDCLGSAQIVGGDITGSDKIFISVCAIGATLGRKISSRSNAKAGYKIITNGTHGSSGTGLFMLQNGISSPEALIKAHLEPQICCELSDAIAKSAKHNYAMTDSSDGLADALLKIAEASNVSMSIDFDKIPYNKEIRTIDGVDYKHMIFYGAEDYKLVCAVHPEDLNCINKSLYAIIGEVQEKDSDIFLKINGENSQSFNKQEIEKNMFKHFKTEKP